MGGDHLNPPKLVGINEKRTKQKTGRKDLKLKRDSLSMGSQRERFLQRAGSSGEPLRNPVATSEPVVEISAKDKDKPMVKTCQRQNQRLLFWGSKVLTHHCRELVLLTHLQELKQAEQELGAVSNQEMQARSSKEKPPQAPLKGQGRRTVSLQKWPEL
jgi:hypothetical protein